MIANHEGERNVFPPTLSASGGVVHALTDFLGDIRAVLCEEKSGMQVLSLASQDGSADMNMIGVQPGGDRMALFGNVAGWSMVSVLVQDDRIYLRTEGGHTAGGTHEIQIPRPAEAN